MASTFLMKPNSGGGRLDDTARFKRIDIRLQAYEACIADLARRVEQLEAKRGPGRPPNPAKDAA